MSPKLSNKQIVLVALIALFAITAIVFMLRAESKKFRDWMDKIIPEPFNPFAMANILLKANQESYVREMHPEVQNKFRAFIKEVEDSGWTVIPTSGYRDFQKQLSLWRQNSSNARPGKSHHNYGLALDINASKGTQYLRKSSSESAWVNSGIPAIAKKHGISWQYAFGSYKDPIHFYVKHDTSKLLQRAIAKFGSEENIIGNQVPLT